MTIDISDLKHLFMSAGGIVIGYIFRMFGTEAKIKTDLAFIRGQLTQILNMVGDIDALKAKHATIEKDQAKLAQDINAAHEALRGAKGA